MIRLMVVGFCSIGVDVTLDDGCGIWEHFLMDGYISLSTLVVEHGAGSQSRQSQIESYG